MSIMRKNALLFVLAATLFLVGTGCDTIVTLDKPVVSAVALDTDKGGTLRLTWTAITDAKSYEITTDDSTYTTTSTSFDVTTPSATVEVAAVNGNDKSDAAVIDCKVVETSSLILYDKTDPDPTHPSGLAFTTSGSASAMSLEAANQPSLDFVCDKVTVTPVGLVNAGDYGWATNTKLNTLMDAGTTDYDAFKEAASTGYITQLSTATNGVYALWMSSSTAWTASDHFGKAKIISIEDVGGYSKVTMTVAYQKIGGLRWLVK
jgi:hypothetical protein